MSTCGFITKSGKACLRKTTSGHCHQHCKPEAKPEPSLGVQMVTEKIRENLAQAEYSPKTIQKIMKRLTIVAEKVKQPGGKSAQVIQEEGAPYLLDAKGNLLGVMDESTFLEIGDDDWSSMAPRPKWA